MFAGTIRARRLLKFFEKYHTRWMPYVRAGGGGLISRFLPTGIDNHSE